MHLKGSHHGCFHSTASLETRGCEYKTHKYTNTHSQENAPPSFVLKKSLLCQSFHCFSLISFLMIKSAHAICTVFCFCGCSRSIVSIQEDIAMLHFPFVNIVFSMITVFTLDCFDFSTTAEFYASITPSRYTPPEKPANLASRGRIKCTIHLTLQGGRLGLGRHHY